MSKLTSRKFLAMVTGVLTGIVLLINGNTTEGTAAIVSAVVGYMLAEGIIDACAVGKATQVIGTIDDVVDAVKESMSSEEIYKEDDAQ